VVVVSGSTTQSATREVATDAAAPRIVAMAGGKAAGYVVIYATGLGNLKTTVAAGSPAPLDPLAQTAVEPIVRIGSLAARVFFSGLAPGLVGVYQINAEWRADASTPAEVSIEAGGRLSNMMALP
jgi:uncharacterized protein (TIGR03437 family)